MAEVNYHELAADTALGSRERPGVSSIDKLRVKKARHSLEVGQPMEVFEELNGSTLAQTGLELRKMVDRFGLKRDTDTNKKIREGNEQARFDKTKAGLEKVLTFLEKGYDQLQGPERAELMATLEHSLLNSRNTLARKHISGLTATERRAFLTELVQSADYANEVRAALENVKRLKITEERGVIRAKGVKQISEHNVQATGEQKVFTAEDLKRAINVHTWTKSGTYMNRDPQAKIYLDQIDTAKDRLLAARQRELTLMGTVRAAAAQGGMNRQNYQDNIGQYQAAQMETKIAEENLNVQYKNLLSVTPSEQEAEQRRYDRHGVDSQTRGMEVQSKNKLVEAEVLNEELANDREAEEMAIQGEVESIFGKALERKIVGDMQKSLEILHDQEPKVKEEFAKDVRKEVLTHLESRWIQPVTKGFGIFRKRGQDYKMDSKQVRRDYEALLGANGPAALTEVMLKRARIKDTSGAKRSLSKSEVTDLMKNEDFTGEMKNVLIQQILSREFTLRKVTPGAIHKIMNSWGREMIDTALNEKNTYRQMVQDLAQTGDMSMKMDNPTFLARFIKAARRRPNLLIDAAVTQEEQDTLAHRVAA